MPNIVLRSSTVRYGGLAQLIVKQVPLKLNSYARILKTFSEPFLQYIGLVQSVFLVQTLLAPL